jgi:hypothetical protein
VADRGLSCFLPCAVDEQPLITLALLQVLDTPEPLRNLAELIAAQMEYHKKAYEILSELAPVIDGLQVEQEAGHASAYSLS